MFGLAMIFGGEGRNEYTIGVVQSCGELDTRQHPFLDTRYIQFVVVDNVDDGMRKVARHQLDLLVDFAREPRYWINPDSPKGYFA